MGHEKAGEAVEAFKRYAEAFERLEARAVVSFYHEPALLISPQGIVALPTGVDVERFFSRLTADLRAEGYAKSEFPQLSEHYLSSDLSVVSGVGVWRKANGEELRRFGLTYTLCRALPSWKIVVAAIHDPDAALHLT
jgi:ketosteroid isomerase-like protein